MKVATTIPEAHGLDARGRDASRSSSDAGDGKGQPFDDVLTGVGADGKAAGDDKPAQTKGASETPLADNPGLPPPSSDASVGVQGGDFANLTALIEAFGKSGSTDASQVPVHGVPKTGMLPSEGLEKRGSTKDDATSALQDDVASVPPTTPSNLAGDFMSMLLAGAGGVAVPQTPTTASRSSAPQSPTLAKSGDLGAIAADEPTQTAAVIVSDISVSTHLAPVTDTTQVVGPRKDATAPSPKSFLQDVPKAAPDELSDAPAQVSHKKLVISETGSLDASAASLSGSLGPTRTIATAIGALAAQPEASASTTGPGAADVSKPFVSVARTLNLKMSPASLGTVDIRLHVSGQALDVQLTVSSAQTLGIVTRDRDALSSALRDQNYQVNSLVIQDGGAAASFGGNNATQDGQTSGGGQRHNSPSSGGGSAARDGDRPGQGPQQSGREARRDRSSPASPAADEPNRALFV